MQLPLNLNACQFISYILLDVYLYLLNALFIQASSTFLQSGNRSRTYCALIGQTGQCDHIFDILTMEKTSKDETRDREDLQRGGTW